MYFAYWLCKVHAVTAQMAYKQFNAHLFYLADCKIYSFAETLSRCVFYMSNIQHVYNPNFS